MKRLVKYFIRAIIILFPILLTVLSIYHIVKCDFIGFCILHILSYVWLIVLFIIVPLFLIAMYWDEIWSDY